MKFDHKDDGLEITFSWKEIFNIFRTKKLKFNRKSSYMFYTHFMRLISEGIAKYGDTNEHGYVDEKEEIKPESL